MRRTVLFVAAGAVAMAMLLPCLALVRDTTAHEWYAARKLTVVQVMLGVGFDPYKAMVYRTSDGAGFGPIGVSPVFRLSHCPRQAWFSHPTHPRCTERI